MPRLLHNISVRYPICVPVFVFQASKRLPWDLIDSLFEALWAKNGKYEYCYLFSNSQNSPKCRSHGLHASLYRSNSTIADLYVFVLMNIF